MSWSLCQIFILTLFLSAALYPPVHLLFIPQLAPLWSAQCVVLFSLPVSDLVLLIWVFAFLPICSWPALVLRPQALFVPTCTSQTERAGPVVWSHAFQFCVVTPDWYHVLTHQSSDIVSFPIRCVYATENKQERDWGRVNAIQSYALKPHFGFRSQMKPWKLEMSCSNSLGRRGGGEL